jgi:phage terminase small subunit
VAHKLTPKQEKFCQEYIVDLNATQSAIRAGYSVRTARSLGQENLTKPDIQERLSELRSEQEKRVEITADAVLKELASIGFGSLSEMEGFRGSDKIKALELLGKHKGIFVDKLEMSGPGGGPISTVDLSKLTDEDLAALQRAAEIQHGSSSSSSP